MTVLARPARRFDGLGHHPLIHMGEPLDRDDDARDSGGGFLDLRRKASNQASSGCPSQDRGQRRSGDHPAPVQRLECHRCFGERFGNRRIDVVLDQPVRDGLFALRLLNGRQHAVDGGGDAGPAELVDGGELIVGEPGCRQRPRRVLGGLEVIFEERRAPLDRRHRVVQLVGEAGDSFPSDAIFSSRRSLRVNSRARSSILWTRMEVISWHSRIIAPNSAPGISLRRISVGSKVTDSPGAPTRREYGKRRRRPPLATPSPCAVPRRGR